MASSLSEYFDSLKVKDLFDDIWDTDPEETATLSRYDRELNEEANKKINSLLQALIKRVHEFRSGRISGSYLSCEIFRLSYLINDEVVS